MIKQLFGLSSLIGNGRISSHSQDQERKTWLMTFWYSWPMGWHVT